MPRPGPAVMLLPSPTEPTPLLLANTIWADRSGLHDSLETTAQLSAWLDAVGDRLFDIPGRAGAAARRSDVTAFRELRAAIRGLAAAVTGDPRPDGAATTRPMTAESAVRVLNTAAAGAPVVPQLSWPAQQATVRPPRGTRAPAAALAAVAGAAVALFALPDSRTLRACLAPGCVLYFCKDHPRREWCSLSCGNRARAARHYRRHRH